MNKNATVPKYVGVDVAKATLQVHLQGHQIEFENTASGHIQLCNKLRALTEPHVVCEATGGYEAAMAQAFHDANITVSVVNPAHVRAAAKAQGKRAKTDPLDAASLTDYGQRFQPAPTPEVAALQRQIRHLVLWLKQLIDAMAVAKAQAEHQLDAFVKQQHAQLLTHYHQQIKLTEEKVKTLLAQDHALQQRVDCLMEIEGVGLRTALMVLAYMPELGTINRGQAAALAGLAPWTRDSGTMKGKRCIGGGRAEIRPVLYMSSLSSIRYNSILKAFYKGLRERNKPGKVALTAVMRKLLVYMNYKLKHLQSPLAEQKLQTPKL